MTRILTSFAIIVAAVAVIAGGTYALVFSDTETLNGSTLSAGTVGISFDSPQTIPFDIDGMLPGDVEELRLDIVNDGDVDAQIAMSDVVVSGSWSNGLGDKYIKVIDVKYKNGANWDPISTDPVIIGAGNTLKLKVYVEFENDSVDDQNAYMGETYTADLSVTATQVDSI